MIPFFPNHPSTNILPVKIKIDRLYTLTKEYNYDSVCTIYVCRTFIRDLECEKNYLYSNDFPR